MAEFLTEFITDLASPPQLRTAPHQFAMGDNNAYTFTALVANTAEPEAALLAGTVSGTALRPDGTTVALEGVKGADAREVNVGGAILNATPCSVTLPQACFAYPGRVLVSIKLVTGTTATTVLAVTGTVVRTETDAAVDPGEIIPSVQELIDEIHDAVDSIPADYSALLAAVAPTFSASTNYTAGMYVWREGVLYRFTTAHPAGAWSGEDASTISVADGLLASDIALSVAGSPQSAVEYGIPFTGTISGGGAVRKNGNVAVVTGTNTSTTSRVMKFSGDSFYVNGSATENSAHTAGHHDLLPGRTYRLTMRVLSGTIDYVNTTNLRNNRFALCVYNYATGATSGTYLSGRLSELINDAKYEAATTYSETAAYYKRVVYSYSSGNNINFVAVSVYAESGTTATRAYAAGDYIAAGTTLYKATASIASGDTLAEGVNVVVPDDLYTDKKGDAYPLTFSIVRTFTDRVRVGFCMYISGQQRWNNLTVDWSVEDITEDVSTTSSATPSITAMPGMRYVCSASYVTSLSFTPSATGICSVRFTSGTTPTVLTLPQTVKMPDWWTGVEANRTYEISIEDGVYGAVTSWA